jgi:hypothetical protein
MCSPAIQLRRFYEGNKQNLFSNTTVYMDFTKHYRAADDGQHRVIKVKIEFFPKPKLP